MPERPPPAGTGAKWPRGGWPRHWSYWPVGALALALVALAVRAGATANAGASPPPARPPSAPPTVPTIITSELRFATTPAEGVWAELLVILDNPLPTTPGVAGTTVLVVPGTLLDDYRIRSTEPNVTASVERRGDGRLALQFPPPLGQTLNWYRLEMEVRRPRPRPIDVRLLFDRPAFQTPLTGVRVIYADREADPFTVVPERLVGWLPARAAGALPLLVSYTVAVGALVLVGCAAAFRAVRG